MVGVEPHTKSTLTPYGGQVLKLAIHDGVFHVKARTDVALRQAAIKDAVTSHYIAAKINAKLCHVE